MKRVVFLGLVGLLLALPLSAAAGDPYGSLTLVQERRAGFLEEVRKARGQVVVERGDERLVAERGMAIEEGDVLVTERGACVVTTPEGWRVTVGEDSRVEVRSTWTQRLGTAIYRVRSSFGVRVERVEVLVEGTVFRVTWDGELGEVAVTEGAVRVRGEGDTEAVVRAGERATFTAEAAGGTELLGAADRSALAAQERQLGSPNGGFRSRGKRLRIGLGGGVAAAQERTWGSAQLRARVRLAGPLWLGAGGGLLLRRLGPEDERLTVAIPVVFGLQGVADLPGGAALSVGGSLDLLVGERCSEPIECERVLAAEPGGTVDVGLGVQLGKHLAISAEARLGAGLRHEYGAAFQLSPDAVVAPRLEVAAWLEVLL